jgi:hypothetical protein
LQKTNWSCHFPLVSFSVCGIPETNWHGRLKTWKHEDMEIWRHGHGNLKRRTENRSPRDFLNPLIVCSSCEQKFVVCPFADDETNRSYQLANRLNTVDLPIYGNKSYQVQKQWIILCWIIKRKFILIKIPPQKLKTNMTA